MIGADLGLMSMEQSILGRHPRLMREQELNCLRDVHTLAV